MVVCLIHRHRWPRNLGELLRDRGVPEETQSVGTHEQREAAMAVCLIHRHRWPRNLGELLRDRGVPEETQ
jgi:hypothetical protein